MSKKPETIDRPNIRYGSPATVWLGHDVTVERLFINDREVNLDTVIVPNRLFGSYINEEGEAC